MSAGRRVHALARRRIAVMGHSQGGMSMRWALRFWPDTRRMVADVIGFSGSNHGTPRRRGMSSSTPRPTMPCAAAPIELRMAPTLLTSLKSWV